jgi:hypothetical protein
MLADLPHYDHWLPACGQFGRVCRWLVLDISMPRLFRPLRRLILSSFDKENLRTMAAMKKYAETQSGG